MLSYRFGWQLSMLCTGHKKGQEKILALLLLQSFYFLVKCFVVHSHSFKVCKYMQSWYIFVFIPNCNRSK